MSGTRNVNRPLFFDSQGPYLMTRLVLTNTFTGSKEPVLSSANNTITLYVCGITPYDYAHVGHGRCYVTFDLLVRVLTLLSGYKGDLLPPTLPTLMMTSYPLTDKEFGDQHRYHEAADRYITAYQEDVARLGCLPPTYEPRVTDNISSIIEFIAGLIERNLAYGE